MVQRFFRPREDKLESTPIQPEVPALDQRKDGKASKVDEEKGTVWDDHRVAVKEMIEREVRNIIQEQIRSAAQELLEEQRKAIREAVEQHRLLIKEALEEVKASMRGRVEDVRGTTRSFATRQEQDQ